MENQSRNRIFKVKGEIDHMTLLSNVRQNTHYKKADHRIICYFLIPIFYIIKQNGGSTHVINKRFQNETFKNMSNKDLNRKA